jgi:hypothetical protein
VPTPYLGDVPDSRVDATPAPRRAPRGRTSAHCVTSPGNTESLAFHGRPGFRVEAEVDGYDGSGESRVLLARTL